MPNRQRKPRPAPSDAIATPTPPTWPQLPARTPITPLDHMLQVLNDPTAAANRRDKMAIAAAPYIHGRIAEKGKKVVEREAAATAGGADSEWQDDLDPTRPQ